MSKLNFRTERALDWFTRFSSESICVSTGSHRLNSVLSNGIDPCKITEIVGECSTGKTQLCLTVIVEMLLNRQKDDCMAVYLDFNGSFNITRLLQILKARSNHVIEDSELKQMLNRVIVKRVHDHDKLRDTLYELVKLPESEAISILIVDSIGCMLSDTAFRLHDGVLMVNHLVTWDKQVMPSLGKKWRSNPLITRRIYLTRFNNREVRNLKIENQSVLIPFIISENGFNDA